MRQMSTFALLAVSGLCLLGSSSPARALVIAPGLSGPQRVKAAELIVVGSVVGLEDRDIAVKQGKTTVNYRIAVVQVSDTLKGKSKNMIRVGFYSPNQPNQPGRPPVGRPVIRPFPRPGRGSTQLKVGMDGLLFLQKNKAAKFYTLPQGQTFVPKNYDNRGQLTPNKQFASEVSTTRSLIRVLDNPIKSLQAKKLDDRLVAASLILQSYNNVPMQRALQDKLIPTKEARLILKTLAEADWDQQNTRQNYMTNPSNIINQFGIMNSPFPAVEIPQRDRNVPYQQWLAKRNKILKDWAATNWKTYDESKLPIVKTVKDVTADPIKALKSKSQKERQFAAALLIQKYRTYTGSQEQVAIPAEESKLIMKAIANADWDQNKYRSNYMMNPFSLVSRIGVRMYGNNADIKIPNRKRGEDYRKWQAQRNAIIKKWVQDNANTYQIKKYKKGNGVNQNVRPGFPRPVPLPAPVPGGPVQILPVRPGRPVRPIQIQPARPVRPARPVPGQVGGPVQVRTLPARIDRKDD